MRLLSLSIGIVVLGLAAMAAPVLLPRGEGHPPLRDAEAYLTNVERAIFNGSQAEVRAALQTEETGVLAYTEATDRIPALTGTTPVEGAFPNPDAIRMVNLATGDTAAERVLVNTEDRFAYQVWGFTAGNSRPIDHIRGEFEYIDQGDGTTEVIWTYAIAPRVFWARPFIQDFLDNDFAPFMESGLQGAANAFNTRPAG